MPTRDRSNRLKLFRRALGPAMLVGLALVILTPPGRLAAQGPPAASVPRTADSKAAITKVLDDQTLAWNRGDLDTFLAGYWRSPKVVFQSGGTRHDGFDAMRDRYRKRYQSDGRAMGQLTFPDLEIELLGADAAFVRGRYALTMPDGTHPSGLFTLILRRFDDGWKITHDHTSAADPAPAAPSPPVAPLPPGSPRAPG